MLDKVRAYIKTNELISPGDSLVLGVSGGADSVALLLLLSELAEEFKIRLYALHVNHNLRGEEALRDQHFTEELCRKWNVPLTIVSEQVAELAKQEGIGCEEAGRKLRYKSFAELAKNCGASKIAVAHHMDDNAETLIFRLARGTGLKGLAGMAASRRLEEGMTVIRPMLCLHRSEIEEWLAAKGQNYCTDSSNKSDEYSRNLIRNRIMPSLEELNSGAGENLCALAEQAAAAYDYLERRSEELYGDLVSREKTLDSGIKLIIKIPSAPERILFELLLRKALFEVAEHEKDITARHIKMLYELRDRQTGSRISLPYGVEAEKSYDRIILRKLPANEFADAANDSFFVRLDEDRLLAGEKLLVDCPGFGCFEFSLLDKSEKTVIFLKDDYTKYFDYDRITETPTVRYSRDDDLIAIGPQAGTKQLNKLFTDCKLPREKRRKYPVIAENRNVLWLPGLRTGENRRVESETSKILKIEWRQT